MNSLTDFVCTLMIEHFESLMSDLSYAERKEIYESLLNDRCEEFNSQADSLLFETIWNIDGPFKAAIQDCIDYDAAYKVTMTDLYENHIKEHNDSEGSTDCE